MVDRFFYNTFLFILYEGLIREQGQQLDETTIKREEFCALAIILKFHPQNTVFYLSYLFNKYNTHFTQSLFLPNTQVGDIVVVIDGLEVGFTADLVERLSQYMPIGINFNHQYFITAETINGMVEDKGIIKNNEIVIRTFMKLYELIITSSYNSYNLDDIAENYFNCFNRSYNEPLAIVILCVIANLFKYLGSSEE